jgi:malonyl-CoA O-methyltransferase
MNQPDLYRLDRTRLRASFQQAAATYDGAAHLQREVAERLFERLDLIRLLPGWIADIGAGTGLCTRKLARRFPRARVLALDLADAMLQVARRKGPRLFSRPLYVCADLHRLPLAPGRFDLVFSNLTLQWCEDLNRAFLELHRALAPGGLLLFSSLGPDTLSELRNSWSHLDERPHVNRFPDLHEVGDHLCRAGLTNVVVDVDRITRHHPDVLSLLRELKALGAHNVTIGRPRTLTPKPHLTRLQDAYEVYRSPAGLPATFEVVYGHAWAPVRTATLPVSPSFRTCR